jgi:hypothetical protein
MIRSLERRRELAEQKYSDWLRMWDNGASLREISSAFERKGNWRAVYRQMLILRKNFGWFQPRPKNTGVESAKVTYANWLRLWDEGKGTREIALIAKRIPNTVSTIVSTLRKKYGLFPPQRKPTFSELYPDVVELCNAGKTTMEIAASTGRTYRATSHLISRGRYYRALAPRERGRKQFLVPNGPKTRRNRGQTTDKKLSWLLEREFCGPAIEPWRLLGERYIAHLENENRGGFSLRLASVGKFLHRYISRHQFHEPTWLLDRTNATSIPPLIGDSKGMLFLRTKASHVVEHNYDAGIDRDGRSNRDGQDKRNIHGIRPIDSYKFEAWKTHVGALAGLAASEAHREMGRYFSLMINENMP